MRFGLLKYALTIAMVQSVWAVPALNRYFDVIQEDGTTVQVRNVGDEKFHYQETSSGKILTKGNFKHFSQKPDSSQIVEARIAKSSVPAIRPMPEIDPKLNNGEKKALVLLVQFKDSKFSLTDPATFYENFLNKENFNELNNVGSVRDYFKANSDGAFIPNFTVVGPITLSGNVSAYSPSSQYGDAGAAVALSEALDTLVKRKTISFSDYDQDKDQVVDFVHMIYAGPGANDAPNEDVIWPHMWYIPDAKKVAGNIFSGTYVFPYSCTSELDGIAYAYGKKIPAGVGTFIHEFGHVLGLPDMYSSDESLFTPSSWDVMDAGSYNCPSPYYYGAYPTSCAPPNYSAFEKISLGWMQSQELPLGEDTLASIVNNKAYQVTNPKNEDEFYLIEYRTKDGWDAGLPNHGMLIWHIDYYQDAWDSALVNATSHMRVDLIEADGKANETTLSADVFPGTSRTKSYKTFSSFTTWDGQDLDYSLSDITEDTENGFVTFIASKKSAGSSSSQVDTESSSSEASTESSSSQKADESSSSEVSAESSSSEVSASSSSSQDVIESCSSEAPEESSSSQDAIESSSSEVPAESSSSSTTIVEVQPQDTIDGLRQTGIQAQSLYDLHAFRSENTLFVTGLPQGEKTLRLFSLNGNLLYDTKSSIDHAEINMKAIRGPVILHITLKNRPIYSKRIR